MATRKQKKKRTKFKTNTSIDCPSIHLPRTQFRCQDYNEYMTCSSPNCDPQNAIELIDNLLKQFCTLLPPKKVHIVHISDTHLSYNDYAIPFKKDMLNVLIHSGDLSHSGCLHNGRLPKHFYEFSKWFRSLPHQKKVIIAGNHDIAFRQLGKDKIHSTVFNNDSSVIYLEDDSVNLYGICMYGTPWTDKGAFKPTKQKGRCKKLELLCAKWEQIPNGIDLLISHQNPSVFSENGNEDLLCEVVTRVCPKAHLFGHNHKYPGLGWKVYEKVMFVNSAMDKRQTSHEFDVIFDL